MEKQEGEGLGLSCYEPKVGDEEQSRGFDRSVREGVEPMEVDQCETAGDMDDSQLVGASDAIAPKNGVLESAALGLDASVVDVEVKLAAKGVEKRKRGRPPRLQGQVKVAPKHTEEEDVCFICFDGGSLVLCDRRGCPKAYHPACIKRDEAFFRSKAKWNCGWHICSSCRKASHYMCYTCTYSLCKGCIKDADYVCVRGNKGLCGTCMRTIMLIENIPGNKEMAQVDFDDKTSWEYLFKVYWVLLKGQLSLTLDEVIKAKNPWKGPSVLGLISGSSGEFYRGNIDKHSILGGNSSTNLEAIDSKRNAISTKPEALKNENSLGVENSGGNRVVPLLEDSNWASKELLELVAHMKNGDTSAMSQVDAQRLLLEYIKKNNLRDPHQNCEIICDSRLLNMFGKERVGHIEMLQLFEPHFLTKDDSLVNNPISAGLVDAVGSQMESDQNNYGHLAMVNDKKRKVRKRIDEKVQNNLDAYAAIDVHNINLIYLKRNLLETLIDDADKFHEKVVGSIVRIRLSRNDQKPDMHRLVQVVGTTKVAEPYKIGTRETDVMLEILNLDRKEVISIEGISDQDFSQDECKHFCQSITCGLIKRLTVGEIQDKAMALLAVKVNDWLEAEILRLTNLRDRASEKGHRKELRECVEKLQLLNSPEDRQRRLQEVPVVHSDPTMDPSNRFEANSGELDEKGKDDKVKPRNSGFGRKRRLSISPQSERDVLTSSGTNALKDVTTPIEQSRGKETFGINGWNATNDQLNPTGSSTMSGNNQEVAGSVSLFSTASEMPTQPLSTGTNQHVNDFETEKIWHYADPTGKVQGPFAMLQLRKWNSDGLFPPKVRIWRRNEKKENAILLNDALSGQCRKEQLLPFESNLLLQAVKVASYYNENGTDVGWNKSMNDTPEDGKRVGESSNLEQEPSRSSDKNNEVGTCNMGDSNLSSCTALAVVNSNKGQSAISSQGQDSSSNDIWPHQPQVSSSLPTTVLPSKETVSIEVGEDHVTERTDVQSNGNLNVPEGQTTNDQGCGNKSDSEGHSSQSSGQNWRPPPVNSPSKGQDSNSGYTSMAKSVETSEQNQEEIKISDLPSSTPKPSKYISSNVPVQDTGLSWSTASSLVGSGTQFCEVAGEWGGCSAEMTNDHAATPASINDHLTHSPAHPHSITSSWPDIVTDSLVDESVSDLLAEVEAMESLNGLASQAVNGGDELTEVSKSDITSAEVFSPPPDPGKGDALSSTGDAHLQIFRSNFGNSDVLNPEKRSKGYSSVSPDAEGDAKHSDVSVNQFEPAPQSTTRWEADIPWNPRQESMDAATLMDWGLDQGHAMMGWGAGQGTTTHGNTSMNSGASAGGILGSQPRYSEDRFSPRDRAYPSRDSGYNRSGSGRYGWNRQPFSGGGSNGGSFRSPPKGQRICKFYESGFCKKGASCSYWHPPRL